MKVITAEELKRVVTMCWNVASHAEMEGISDGMNYPDGENKGLMREVRWTTYRQLLASLAPNYNITVQEVSGDLVCRDPKESWQE